MEGVFGMSLLPPDFADDFDFEEPIEEPINEDNEPLTYGDTYHFDFTTKEFVLDGLVVELLIDTDALAQRLEQALRTERYTYLVYSLEFGTTWLDTARAGGTSEVLLKTAIESEIAETLLHDRNVAGVVSLEVTLDDPLAPTEADIDATVLDTFGVQVTIPTFTVTL